MAHLALYRKYRPQTFDQLIGEEHVTEPLIAALSSGKLHHAYLFSGPRGCGKTSSARILARSLNCEQGPTPTPCGSCESCVALAVDGPGSLDVVEIDAASHGGVDDARELRERAFFTPASSRFKVYVIDEAHMVSSAGFNALLKLVEEPPEFVRFVFATTEPDKVLATIKSRTHHYPFRLVSPAVLRAHLESICVAEGLRVEEGVVPLVVRAGGGSVRDSLSLLDQLASGASESALSYSSAVALLGVTDNALLDQACDALAAVDGAALFATVDQVAHAGHDPRRFAIDLLERLRDLIILDKVPDAVSKGIIDAPADQLERMSTHTLRLGSASLSRMADIVHDGLTQMKGTTSTRLVLELVCARMLLPAVDSGTGGVLQRLERLERRLDISEPAVPVTPLVAVPNPPLSQHTAPETLVNPEVVAPPPDPAAQLSPAASIEEPTGAEGVSTSAEVLAPAPITGGVDISDVRRLWPELLERLKRRRVVWSLMQNATPMAVDADELHLQVQHQGLVKRFADSGVCELIVETLHELLGIRWRLRATASGAPEAVVGPIFDEPEPTDVDEHSASANSDLPRSATSGSAVSQEVHGVTAPPAPSVSAHSLLQSSLGARVIAEPNGSVRGLG